MRSTALSLLLACATVSPSRPSAPGTVTSAPDPVAWSPWSPQAFARARAQGKHLLVSVQASWCHWCHVMNERTFAAPEIRRRLAEGFVAIKVDSDARPDLAERFADYAWPATVLLTPDAQVVVAIRGYRPPEVLAGLLDDVRAGRPPAPPERSIATAGLDEGLREATRRLDALYDARAHGWGRRQKYPYAAPLEHALFRASLRGERLWRDRALATAEATRRLLDPVFGGAYQYSLRGRWDRPHYEKIAAVQADVLASFARIARVSEDERWLASIEEMRRYLARFFTSADGAFYTSQDADLSPDVPGASYYAMDEAARLRAGIPRVDRSVYANLNGRLIDALTLAHRAGAPGTLPMARDAAEAIEATRRADGWFPHGDASLVFLSDQAWMLRAELGLYEATGERRWIERAERTVAALELLAHPDGGYYAHSEDPAATGVFAERRRPVEENAVVARGLIRLGRLTGRPGLEERARVTLRAVGDTRALRRLGRRVGEWLLAVEELRAPYVLVSVVGPEGSATEALHRAALALPLPNGLVELARPGASRYPFPGEPAAYLCNAEACSLPVTEPGALGDAAARFLALEG